MSKLWKSDGVEQKQLETLFRKKEINADMKPAYVQSKYPIFNGFTAAVFRKHWGLTKQKCDVDLHAYRNPAFDYDETSNSSIPELDGNGPPPKKQNLSLDCPSSHQMLTSVSFHRPPVVPCVYTDPQTKQDKCLVVLLLFSGVKSITFDLIASTDGPEPTLKVMYDWPSSMINVDSMFKKDDESAMFITKMHPKVLAVEKALKNFRDNIEDNPVGQISVKLPVPVQMDPNSWVKKFNKKDDGIIVFFEFQCIRSDYIISKVEKTLKFDK